MSDIFLDTLTYYKSEIDAMHSAESQRINAALNLKIETSEKGIAGGVATLDGSGRVPPIELPLSTQLEVLDPANNTTVITPEQAHLLMKTVYQVYEHQSITGITITDIAFQPIIHLVTPDVASGTYEIKISTTFSYNTPSNSVFMRWSIDGGATWEDYRYDARYADEKFNTTYLFPVTHTLGPFDIKLEARCQNTGDVLTIQYANVMVERKK